MDKFCKLYEPVHGQQIAVIKQQSDGDCVPEVRFFFTPPNLGVCSVAVKYEDSDEGWGKCDNYFNSINEESAIKFVTGVESSISGASLTDA